MESMSLLEEATIALLLEAQPESLTVRDIAERAGVHFRYIPDYFGGKAELFAHVYPRVAREAAEDLSFPFIAESDAEISPKLVRTARLALWLSANHPAGVPASDRPIQHRVEEILVEKFGIDNDTATIAAQRLIALVIVVAAFPDVVSNDPIDIRAHLKLELEMLSSLSRR